MPSRDKRGAILFIVIGIIMVVVILTTVTLSIVSNHSRLTYHQVSRIQAEYAAKAGLVFALEKLRFGTWTYSPTNSCPVSTPCVISETGFPGSILSVSVVFVPSGSQRLVDSPHCSPPPGNSFCVSSTADFQYTS